MFAKLLGQLCCSLIVLIDRVIQVSITLTLATRIKLLSVDLRIRISIQLLVWLKCLLRILVANTVCSLNVLDMHVWHRLVKVLNNVGI